MTLSQDLFLALAALDEIRPFGVSLRATTLVMKAKNQSLVLGVVDNKFGGWVCTSKNWTEISPYLKLGSEIAALFCSSRINKDTPFSALLSLTLFGYGDEQYGFYFSRRTANTWNQFWSTLSQEARKFVLEQGRGAIYALEAIHAFGLPRSITCEDHFGLWQFREFAALDRDTRHSLNRLLFQGEEFKAYSSFLGRRFTKRFFRLMRKRRFSGRGIGRADLIMSILKNDRAYKCFSQHQVTSDYCFIVYWRLPQWLRLPWVVDQLRRYSGLIMQDFIEFLQFERRRMTRPLRASILSGLKQIRSEGNFAYWLDRWKGMLADTGQPLKPPFPSTDTLVALDTGDKLLLEGKSMHNCIFKYFGAVVGSHAYAYHWAGTEQATVLLFRSRMTLWEIVEIRGFGNVQVSQDSEEAIKSAIYEQLHESHD